MQIVPRASDLRPRGAVNRIPAGLQTVSSRRVPRVLHAATVTAKERRVAFRVLARLAAVCVMFALGATVASLLSPSVRAE